VNVNRQLRVLILIILILRPQVLFVLGEWGLLRGWLSWGLIGARLGAWGSFGRTYWGCRLHLIRQHFLDVIQCASSVLSAMIVVWPCITVARGRICGTDFPLWLTSWCPSGHLVTTWGWRLHPATIGVWISRFKQRDVLLWWCKRRVHLVLVLIVIGHLLFNLWDLWECFLIAVSLWRSSYLSTNTIGLIAILVVIK
jgi:hypothetical protein